MDAVSLSDFQSHYLWAVIAGAVLSFLLGFGMGANDVSNAFGTSVGSKVLSLKWAYILATIFETLGAVLVGFNVSDTMRKSVIDLDMYKNEPAELLLGQIAILTGGTLWLFCATYFKAPISTTHSIVGATLGFSVLLRGINGIEWLKVAEIAASWIVSPLLSGLVSSGLYIIVDLTVLRKKDPLNAGFRALPVLYFACVAFNVFVVTNNGSKILHLSNVPVWIALLLSFGFGIASALIFYLIARPYLRKWVLEGDAPPNTNSTNSLNSMASTDDESNNSKVFHTNLTQNEKNGKVAAVNIEPIEEPTIRTQKFSVSPKKFFIWFLPDRSRQQDEKIYRLFSALQICTACFAGFAHGANDTSNSIAPITAIIEIYKTASSEQTGQTPVYILIYGVFAACVGLWLLGHRVIKTVGSKMSIINPVSGFCIEFGAGVTALLASKAGLPISTSHSLIGSVIFVGLVRSKKGVKWTVFRDVALSWLITLPVSALLSFIVMFFLRLAFL
ncbi:Phosphate transporter [Aphelenchoides bicaudatus]|nr:Phosphate transporter [Aphelenchoides bicaudatus]